MKKLLLFATSAVIISGVPALAQDANTSADSKPAVAANKDKKGGPGLKGHSMFEQADANGDGIVTKEEFLSNTEKFFASLDTNNDSKVTKDELEAKRNEYRQKMHAVREQRKAEMAAKKATQTKDVVKTESITPPATTEAAPAATTETTPPAASESTPPAATSETPPASSETPAQ